MSLSVTGVRFTPSALRDAATGLLGYVSFDVGGLSIDGVALRRTRDGRAALSFPERRDARGRRHPIVRPRSDRLRREVETQVFQALGLEVADER